MQPILKLHDVSCQIDGASIVENIDFQLRPGENGCLLGPSGCGKTTLLRAIAGFQPLSSGSIAIHGNLLSTQSNMTPPEDRQVGLVFQDYALFPHLTIADNIGFGLRRQKRKQRKARITELLQLIDLPDAGQRYPHQLSGGQQQRVALARAMAPKPELILMDEPFSGLDVTLRRSLAFELRELLKSEGATLLLVTHDQDEAFAMSDQIGVMQHGRLRQWGSPYDIYHRPVDSQVASFVGEGRFIDGQITIGNQVNTLFGALTPTNGNGYSYGDKVKVLLRPDDIVPANSDSVRKHSGVVMRKAFKGAVTEYLLQLTESTQVTALFPSHHDLAVEQTVEVALDAEHVVVFQP